MVQVIIMVHGSNDGGIHAAQYAWNSKKLTAVSSFKKSEKAEISISQNCYRTSSSQTT